MKPALIIADCEPGFHHPEGHLELCVPDQVPQNILTLDGWGIFFLIVLICFLFGIRGGRDGQH